MDRKIQLPKKASFTKMFLNEDAFLGEPFVNTIFLNNFLAGIELRFWKEITLNGEYYARQEREELKLLRSDLSSEIKEILVREIVIIGFELGEEYSQYSQPIAQFLMKKEVFELNRKYPTINEIHFINELLKIGASIKEDPAKLWVKNVEG